MSVTKYYVEGGLLKTQRIDPKNFYIFPGDPMENYLPNDCYRDKPLIIEGIVIHYFSLINVQPNDPYNLQDNWQLMMDLNMSKENRQKFLNKHGDPGNRMYASAHCLIGRNGELWLTVPADKQAFHAGVSRYAGRSNWNALSYGIELIGSATSGFTDAQYATLIKHVYSLMKEHNVPLDMVVGHEDIAPGRKNDPGILTGNFDMNRLRLEIYNLIACNSDVPT